MTQGRLNHLMICAINQGCNKGQKSGGAGSNAARRRCPAVPSDLPKSGGAVAPPAPPLVACLLYIMNILI